MARDNGSTWNCEIAGAVPKAECTVKATRFRVGADDEVDAAVRAGAEIRELFKAFVVQGARVELTTLKQPAIRPEVDEESLPVFQVDLHVTIGKHETRLLAKFPTVRARGVDQAIAKAGGLLWRQLAVELDTVEILHAGAVEVHVPAQPKLFGTTKKLEDLPPAEVPPLCLPGDVCECGHAIGRHAGDIYIPNGVVPGKCEACTLTSTRGPEQHCQAFRTRDVEDLRKRHAGALRSEDGVLHVRGKEGLQQLEAKTKAIAGRRRARRDRTGEPTDGGDVTPPRTGDRATAPA